MQSHLSILIKPASSLCNLHCKYCFYRDVSQNRDVFSYGIMTESVMYSIIDKAFDYTTESVSFMFQGGEPSIASLDYFQSFVNRVNEKNNENKKKLKIFYSIQTNGINITEDFAVFMHKNNFLVGLSLDGTKDINDFVRGEGTYKKIMKTAELLKKNKVEFNILCVASSYLVKHIGKVYSFFKKSGFTYLQFIPCLDPLDSVPFSNNYSLTPQLYEYYLKTLFKLWYDDFVSGEYISIRYFDNLVRLYAGMTPEQCGMNGYCDGQFVVESDGSVYPCDFYCIDSKRLGNISDINTTYEEIANSPNMKKFISTSYLSESDTKKCNSCEYFSLCRGGCRRNRDLQSDGTALENIYCIPLYNFYKYAQPMLKNVVLILKKTAQL